MEIALLLLSLPSTAINVGVFVFAFRKHKARLTQEQPSQIFVPAPKQYRFGLEAICAFLFSNPQAMVPIRNNNTLGADRFIE